MLSDTTKGRWMRPALATVAGVLVIGGVTVGVRACDSEADSPAAEQSAQQPSFDLSAPPEDVIWTPVGPGVKLPTSGKSGPTGLTAFAATGFEQSPQGAALAAIQNSVRVGIASNTQWPETLRSAVAAGPGRDAFAVARAQVDATPSGDAEALPIIRGYEFEDFSPQEASVRVFTSYSDDSMASTHVELLWRDGDWKIVMPDPEDPEATATVRSLDSFPDSMIPLEAP